LAPARCCVSIITCLSCSLVVIDCHGYPAACGGGIASYTAVYTAIQSYTAPCCVMLRYTAGV
jgi:hypothetical protein